MEKSSVANIQLDTHASSSLSKYFEFDMLSTVLGRDLVGAEDILAFACQFLFGLLSRSHQEECNTLSCILNDSKG